MSDTGNKPDPRRGQWRDAIMKPIDPEWLRSVGRKVAAVMRGGAGSDAPPDDPPGGGVPPYPSQHVAGVPEGNRDGWMGPGVPIRPVVQNPADVAGRAYDYPAGTNLGTRPRRDEGTSFEELKLLADNWDLLRLAIETRKDQFGNLTWSCMPSQKPGQQSRQPADDRCAKIEAFFRRPDRRLPWTSWVRQLIEQQLVIDAPAIYVRRTVGGEVYSLDIVDGATIDVKVDLTGRTPMPPEPAYQQIIKGVPAINYTSEELIYWPRNPRPGHRYGCSPVQQIIMTINIAMRREVAKLANFTEGNIPDALISVPKDWTPDQIAHWQAMWDAMNSDQRDRRKAKFIPGDMNFMSTRSDQLMGDTVDEWLARIVCFCLSLPPLPFVKMMNRNTAESAYDAALEEGLQPMILWFKSLLDYIVQDVFGYADLEMVPDDIRKVDPGEQEARDLELVKVGLKSLDEVRIDRGLDPIGMGPALWGVGPLGIMLVKDFLKASQQGLAMPQAAPPPDAMGGVPGAPMGAIAGPPAGGGSTLHPLAAATLQGVSPRLLDAVGAGAGGKASRIVDVTEGDVNESDPLSNVVVHPNVLKTLREAEAHQRKRGMR